MSDVYTPVSVRAYRYTTLVPPYDGTGPIPSATRYEIVRLVDFPEDYVHGRLKPYYESFYMPNNEAQSRTFGQQDAVEIVYDLVKHKFCWIDLSVINQSTLREFQATMAANPIDVPFIDLDT